MGIWVGKRYVGGKISCLFPGPGTKQSNITAMKTNSYKEVGEKDARTYGDKQVRSRSCRFRVNRECCPSDHPPPFAAILINCYRNNSKQQVTGKVGYTRRELIWSGTVATSHDRPANKGCPACRILPQENIEGNESPNERCREDLRHNPHPTGQVGPSRMGMHWK